MELLKNYNPHWESGKMQIDLVARPHYTAEMSSLMDRKEIVVLKGIRRAGKSSLIKLFIQKLLNDGVPPQNICYINLEDYRLGSERDVNTLENVVQSYQNFKKPENQVFLFLDEIQEIKHFEKWLRTIYDTNANYKLVITGSSSSLLSGEFSTLLTGRHIALEIFPFTFAEVLAYRNPDLLTRIESETIDSAYLSELFGDLEPYLHAFLYEGGFPEAVKHAQQQVNAALLQQYFDDILFRDVAARYSIRKIPALQKLALYLVSNMANEFSSRRMANLLAIHRETIIDLIGYLKQVYLVFTTSNFSFSLNERLNTRKPKKVYCIDNGLFSALKQTETPDMGKRVENLVFLHLRTNWQEEIFYWKGKVEIDFVLGNGFPVNVTAQDELEEREINGLLYYMTQFNQPRGLLISWNHFTEIEENDRKILVLPLWLFLLKSRQEIMALLK